MKNRFAHLFVVVFTVLVLCVSIASPGRSAVQAAGIPPTAQNHSYTINEGSVLRSKLRATDPDSSQLTYSIVAGPAHGVANVSNAKNGNFTYTPDAYWNGTDSFTFKANDKSSDSNIATITIIVRPVNTAPTARNDSFSTDEDAPLVVPAAAGVLANDTDPNPGDVLAAVLAVGPVNGSLALATDGSFTYTPNLHWNGTDTFTYRTRDGKSSSNLATVTITVRAVNYPPVAFDNIYLAVEDVPFTIAAPGVLGNDNDVDPEDPALTASLVSTTSRGTLVLSSNGGFSYTPNPNLNGNDSFTYRAYDGKAYSQVATVTIAVNRTNDAPVAQALSFSTNEDTAHSGQLVATDIDLEDVLSYAVVADPSHGSVDLNPVDGSFTYTPLANYNGPDSFTFKANDKIVDSNVATVTITVNAVNDPPVAAGASFQVDEDNTLSNTVSGTATDIDSAVITYSVVAGQGPSHGTLNFNSNGTFTYTPAANFNGDDNFYYVASDDAQGVSAPAPVSIKVISVEDTPVLAVIPGKVVDSWPLTFTAVATDGDNADDLDFTLDTGTPAVDDLGAQIDINTGVFSWDPTTLIPSGFYYVTVRVTDGTGLTDFQQVTILVSPNIPITGGSVIYLPVMVH